MDRENKHLQISLFWEDYVKTMKSRQSPDKFWANKSRVSFKINEKKKRQFFKKWGSIDLGKVLDVNNGKLLIIYFSNPTLSKQVSDKLLYKYQIILRFLNYLVTRVHERKRNYSSSQKLLNFLSLKLYKINSDTKLMKAEMTQVYGYENGYLSSPFKILLPSVINHCRFVYEDKNVRIRTDFEHTDQDKVLFGEISKFVKNVKKKLLIDTIEPIKVNILMNSNLGLLKKIIPARQFVDMESEEVFIFKRDFNINILCHESVHLLLMKVTDCWPKSFWREGIADGFYDIDYYINRLHVLDGYSFENVFNDRKFFDGTDRSRLCSGMMINFLLHKYGSSKLINAYRISEKFSNKYVFKYIYNLRIKEFLHLFRMYIYSCREGDDLK